MVRVQDIVYIEAADKYLRVLTAGQEYLIRTPLKDLLPQLDHQQFWQIHRSTVVRADAIASVQRAQAAAQSGAFDAEITPVTVKTRKGDVTVSLDEGPAKAKLDKITISVISPNSASQSIKSKKFDMINVVNSQWKEVKGTKGYNFVAHIPLSYSYMGFKVGKWDKKTGSVKMNKNSKMSNRYLRQAMGYAMNVDEVTQHYTQGLSFRVKTLVPESFGDFHDKSVKGFPLNIKKANALLDKAGYKKKKGETYRRDPNGKKLTIHLAAMSGSPNQEAIVQNYIQQWKKIGLHVTLTTGRLIEFNSFYDKVQNDDPSVDVFMGAWSLSSEPTQDDLYGPKAPFNFERFATSENTKLLKEMGSDKAFNHSYRVQKFHEWQQYMQKEAFVIPLTNAYNITAVNSKLVNYSTKPSKAATLWYETGFKK